MTTESHPWANQAKWEKSTPDVKRTYSEKIKIATKYLESHGYIVSRSVVLLSRKELAEMLKCSTGHVDNLTTSGCLPAPMNIGKANYQLKRWNIDVINEWLMSTSGNAK